MRDVGNNLNRLINYQFSLGRWLMGIPVTAHWSVIFLPVFLYVLLARQSAFGASWQPFVTAMIFAILLMAFVYLHECGHAFAWRLYDHSIRQIVMTPLGGLCFGPLPRSAREELVITFFGPLVNLLFVVLFLGVLFLWQWGSGRPLGLVDLRGEYSSWSTTGMELLSLAFEINFVLAAFNLLVPMFPMDCGRILRAILATRTTPLSATRAVVRVGVVAGVLIIAGGVALVAFGEILAGMQLATVAVLMMILGRNELERARLQPVYMANTGAYGVGWQESEEEAEEWKTKADRQPQPGFIARWRARRAQLREEQAARQAEETRQRVDALLEKISREGIGNLSKKERDFLSGASKSFRNRVG